MKDLREQIVAYEPENDVEQQYKEEILRQWDCTGDEIFERPDEGHFTASSIILNPAMDKMLMVYHNIYQSMGWTGGHADGAQNLLQKAMDEAKEETGIQEVYPLCSEILSLDILPVHSHKKRGRLVSAHRHYNVTYGLIAPEKQKLTIKPDENSEVRWVSLDEWKPLCSEPHMIPVYEKIIERMKQKQQEKTGLYSYLADVLLPWFADNARDLPWRKDKEPYHIWLSEIMLQQTRVEAVKGYYHRFLEKLPDIKALAEAPEDELLKLWEGLGYYSRVRNLQKAAQVIMEQHNGVFPSDYAKILALPGIGDYTAGAVASICFDASTPAVDGNVLRVISRITEDYQNILAPAMKKRIADNLRRVYPGGEMAYTFNQSLMELGATVCVPNGAPKCEICPMNGVCLACKNGTWTVLPQKEAKKKRRIEYKTVFVLQCNGNTAVQKRPANGLLASLWQYPNVEGTLDTQAALNQAQEWGVKPVSVDKVLPGKHIFSHVEWHMTCYYLQCENQSDLFVWADENAMNTQIALPTAFRIFRESEERSQ
ncbi:MAG: A/G-specific adenine glycosylase [Peptococcaceae bacterium]|nr:A/G-specific adenine glycosylase [Peptococcaceae bacterium]